MNNKIREVVFSGIVTVRDKLLAAKDPIRLESGEPSFDTPQHIKDAMTQALKDNHTHYAPSTGIKPLREAIKNKVALENDIAYLNGLNDICVTSGGMHAIYCTLQTILNPGDEVIMQQPNWTATEWIMLLSGAKIKHIPLRPELEYRWDMDDIKNAITKNTKVIFINTPHNPTGSVFTKDDLEHILDFAQKHDLYIVSDEAYEHIIYDEKHYSIAGLAKNRPAKLRDKIITCFTFSKSYAMTGWRVGYTVCTGKEFNENIAKMVLYSINGVSTPSQYAAAAALNGPQDNVARMRDIYRERRDLLFEGVNSTDYLSCEFLPKGAFYLYAHITDAWSGSEWDLVNYLIDTYQMGSVPGEIFYDTRPAIRFSYACETDMIHRAIATLKQSKKKVSV